MSKCVCSLDLGIHSFPTSSENKDDLLKAHFPDLVEFLTKKTEENYFYEGSPSLKLFPPAVLPDPNLPHGFPSSCIKEETMKEKDKWSKKFESIHSEQVVAQRFISYFTNYNTQEGFLFASDFHTDTYLENKKQDSKQLRKGIANKRNCNAFSLPISNLEQNIGDCLGIDIKDMVENSVSNMNDGEIDNNLELEAMAIKDENERKRFRSWVEKNLLSNEDKINYIAYKCYQSAVNERNFEIDMLLVLKDYQAIIEIEVKSTNDSKSVKNVLRKAAGQLRKVNKTFVGFHKDILGEDWKFVRVVAMPNIDKTSLDEDTCCQHCSKFIMNTWETENSSIWIQQILDLIKITACSPNS